MELFRQLSILRQSRDGDWLNVIHYSDCDKNIINDSIVGQEISNSSKVAEYIDRSSTFIKLSNTNTMYGIDLNSNVDQDIGLHWTAPLTYQINISISLYNSELKKPMALWQDNELQKINETISPTKRFFRIGTTEVTIFEIIIAHYLNCL